MKCWDQRGLFIRSGEDEESYLARVSTMPCTKALCSPKLLELYGFSPDWVEVSYSDRGIHFWEAGCSWIDERVNPPAIGIQLRNHFATHDLLYNLYSKEEVLLHEYVHAARFLLCDSKYDEHFCYYTSYSKGFLRTFRALVGPLFQNWYEVAVLLIVLLLPAFAVALSYEALVPLLFGLQGVVMSLLVGRLIWRWKTWFSCKKRLSWFSKKPLHLMIRLTDAELEKIASLSKEQLSRWLEAKSDWRWCFFKRCFLN